MSFTNSRLYRMLKAGEFRIGQRIYNNMGNTLRGDFDLYHDAVSDAADLAKTTYKDVLNPMSMKLTDVFSDAGTRLGGVLGDMVGKINTDKIDYPNSDIVKILNAQEEIALLERETERLRRIARIQHRKRQKLHDLTAKALKSPYI